MPLAMDSRSVRTIRGSIYNSGFFRARLLRRETLATGVETPDKQLSQPSGEAPPSDDHVDDVCILVE